jgi:hypothetical protein
MDVMGWAPRWMMMASMAPSARILWMPPALSSRTPRTRSHRARDGSSGGSRACLEVQFQNISDKKENIYICIYILYIYIYIYINIYIYITTVVFDVISQLVGKGRATGKPPQDGINYDQPIKFRVPSCRKISALSFAREGLSLRGISTTWDFHPSRGFQRQTW